MKTYTKRFYITKLARIDEDGELWHYVGDPLHPNTTFDVGIIKIVRSEIRLGNYGLYVERQVTNLPKEIINFTFHMKKTKKVNKLKKAKTAKAKKAIKAKKK